MKKTYSESIIFGTNLMAHEYNLQKSMNDQMLFLSERWFISLTNNNTE